MKHIKASIALFSCTLAACSALNVQNSKASSAIVKFENTPLIGGLNSDQPLRLGGFSSLQFLDRDGDTYRFRTITDRGPNLDETEANGKRARPFLVPDFNPRVVEFIYDSQKRAITIVRQMGLRDAKRNELNGLPLEVTSAKTMEVAVGPDLKALKNPIIGLDAEGYCQIGNRNLVSDEYGPSLFLFNENFELQKVWSPENSLPTAYARRKVNRGFEGLGCDSAHAYLMLQSPLKSDGENVRILEFDFTKEAVVAEYLYPVNSERADKIGDIALISERKFLVIEQNGKKGREKGVREIYQIDLKDGRILKKKLILNLNDLGLENIEKIEGIAVVDANTFALIEDNDFGLDGSFNIQTGIAGLKGDISSKFIFIHLPDELRLR